MATYINNNVKFHAFSKSPVSGDTTLGGAVNPSGHTITTSQVRAQDIPAFLNTFQGTRAEAITWLGKNYATPAHNDIVYYGGEFKAGFSTPKCLKYNAKAETPAWEDFDITKATTLKNADDKDVIAVHTDCKTVFVDGGNNAATNSNRWSLFVKRADNSILDHFVASTDKIVAGMPSLGYNALVMWKGAAIDEGELDANYVGNTFAGIIHLNKQYAVGDDANNFTVTCFEYIGEKLDSEVAKLSAAINGSATEAGSIANLIQNAIDELGDVAVKSDITITDIKVKVGSGTATSLTPVNKSVTIEIPDAPEASVTADGVVTKDGFTKTAAVTSLANAAINAAITSTDGAIADAIDGAISDATAEVDTTGQVTKEGLVTAGDAQVIANYYSSLAMSEAEAKVASVTLGATIPGGISLGDDAKNPVLTIQTSQAISAEGSSWLISAGAAHSVATHYASVAEGAAVDTVKAMSLTSSTTGSTSGAYVSVTTTGTIGEGISVHVDDSALASTVSAASTAVQSVKVNGTALTKDANKAVDITAIVGVDDTVQSNLPDGKQHGISISKTSSNYVQLSVTPAMFNRLSGSWDNTTSTDYFTTASDVAAAIEHAIDEIVIPAVDFTESTSRLGFSQSYDGQTYYIDLATAEYAASTDTWTNKGYLVTGATVEAFVNDETAKTLDAAKAYSNSLHTTSVTYHVTDTLPTVPAGQEEQYKGRIYLVLTGIDGVQAASGDRIEYMYVQENGVWGWEQIGTTSADLTGYAKSVTINGVTYNVTANDVNLGSYFARKVAAAQATTLANQGSVYANIATDGTLTLGVASATDSVMGVSKMFTGNLSTATSTATDTAVSVKSAQAMYGSLATLANSKVSDVTASTYLSLAGFRVTSTSDETYKQIASDVLKSTDSLSTDVRNTRPATVEGGILTSVDGDKRVIATDKIVDGTNMFATSTIQTWVDDLSNMTNGTAMFKNSSLTVFVGDLSSLETADEMFYGCTLDAESLEILSENLPTVASGTIDIGASTNATAEVIATIKGKGWTLKSNGAAL